MGHAARGQDLLLAGRDAQPAEVAGKGAAHVLGNRRQPGRHGRPCVVVNVDAPAAGRLGMQNDGAWRRQRGRACGTGAGDGLHDGWKEFVHRRRRHPLLRPGLDHQVRGLKRAVRGQTLQLGQRHGPETAALSGVVPLHGVSGSWRETVRERRGGTCWTTENKRPRRCARSGACKSGGSGHVRLILERQLRVMPFRPAVQEKMYR